MRIVFTHTRIVSKLVFHTLWSDGRVAVRNADRERCSGRPVGGVDGAAAAPGDVVSRKITGVAHVIIAQIPVAAVAAVVAAGDGVFGILEPVAFN